MVKLPAIEAVETCRRHPYEWSMMADEFASRPRAGSRRIATAAARALRGTSVREIEHGAGRHQRLAAARKR
jgi:hypothetical protein